MDIKGLHSHVWKVVREGLRGLVILACACGAVPDRPDRPEFADADQSVIAPPDDHTFAWPHGFVDAIVNLGGFTNPASHVRWAHLKTTQPWAEGSFTTITSSGEVL